MRIEGLDYLVNLRELYLSHNGIEEIEGLDNLVCVVVTCVRMDLRARFEQTGMLWCAVSIQRRCAP